MTIAHVWKWNRCGNKYESEQLCGVDSLLLPSCGIQNSNSGLQACSIYHLSSPSSLFLQQDMQCT